MGTFFNYAKLKKGLTGAVTVAAGAVSQGLEVAKNLAEDLTSFKALKDYKLAGNSAGRCMEGQCTRTDRQQRMPCTPCHTGHVASAGPGGSWKIFSAINKKPGREQGPATCAKLNAFVSRTCTCSVHASLAISLCACVPHTQWECCKYNHQHYQPCDLVAWCVVTCRRGVPRGSGVDPGQEGTHGPGQQVGGAAATRQQQQR